jgi:hypothetical protein
VAINYSLTDYKTDVWQFVKRERKVQLMDVTTKKGTHGQLEGEIDPALTCERAFGVNDALTFRPWLLGHIAPEFSYGQ